MGKKTKSKQRLDSFYHYAKQQGFRSRAAYKLIQLNRKYNFLSNSNTLIDLCAAPGGWMQVASQFMPLNSTIIGVDLDPIKKVPGTMSFIGDITTKICYDRLRKQLQGRKCDVVLNDGAPNVGANWNKDAYSQSELVLAALQLACSFLRQGGYFVTKVFRSTDFNSLIWVFNKFFEKVQVTKPKASRFASAEIFVVGIGYLAPSFIDEKLFDAKYIFKDTEADHFRSQMQGQITSIDKLLEDRRKRGGYEDNAPSHLYKQISLTDFINAQNPLLVFAIYNKITVSPEERTKYLDLHFKKPIDTDELLEDIKVIGKRQIQGLLRWRGKIRQMIHKEEMQNKKAKNEQEMQVQEVDQQEQEMDEEDQMEQGQQQQEGDEEQDDQENLQQEQQVQPQQENSEDELQKEMLKKQRKQLKLKRQQNEKRKQVLIRAQAANQQHNEDLDFGEEGFGDLLDQNEDIEDIQYDGYESQQQQKTKKKPQYATYSKKQMQDNLQEMYEARRQKIEQKKQHERQVRQQKKQRKQDRIKIKEHKLNPRKFIEQKQVVEQIPIKKTQKKQKEEEVDNFATVTFQNPLADFDEDIHISSQDDIAYNQKQKINPDEQMQGEVSDDEAYVIPKPQTDMERRRKMMKKQQKKKAKKLKKDIEEGEDTGGQIQIVSHKKMQDYDIDSLAETLAIAKKMLRAGSREEILEKSYRGFTFEDHQQLPKWFTEDQKKHNFKQDPITKQQFQREKQRLAAINAKMPKKIMEAKVRKKIRIQKKLKKVQKKAEVIMNQQGVAQYSKLRQVGKLYDKSKRQLKDKKKYIVGKRTKASGIKDRRNVKHVDSRMKKDKRSIKIKKTRHTHRNKTSRGKF